MNRLQVKMAIIALLMGATSAFAFKAPTAHKNNKLALVWFMYNGNGITVPANYTKVSGTPSCTVGSTLCAIEGPDQGTNNPSQATVNSPTDTKHKN